MFPDLLTQLAPSAPPTLYGDLKQYAPAAVATFLQILKNMQSSMPAVYTLLFYVAYFIGLCSFYVGFKTAARMGSDHRQGNEPSLAWLWWMVFGALFIALPNAVDSFSNSLIGVDPTGTVVPLPVPGSGTGDLSVLVPFFKIVGVIAVMKGILVGRAMSTGTSRDATIGTALTYVIGGVMCLNLVKMMGLLSTLTGMNLQSRFL